MRGRGREVEEASERAGAWRGGREESVWEGGEKRTSSRGREECFGVTLFEAKIVFFFSFQKKVGPRSENED